MIQIVTGTLGAGKTLYCVSEIFDLLCQGEYVATNIKFFWDQLADLALRDRGVFLEPRQLVELDLNKDRDWHKKIPWGAKNRQAPTVHVYLDEVHLFFNARDWAATAALHKQLLAFLSLSRKAKVDVTFIAQEISSVEKQFRNLAEWEKHVTSTAHIPLGMLGQFPVRAFVCVVKDARLGHVLKRIWRTYDKRFFGVYDSYSFLDSEIDDLANEVERLEPIRLARASARQRLRSRLVYYFYNLKQYINPKKCESS